MFTYYDFLEHFLTLGVLLENDKLKISVTNKFDQSPHVETIHESPEIDGGMPTPLTRNPTQNAIINNQVSPSGEDLSSNATRTSPFDPRGPSSDTSTPNMLKGCRVISAGALKPHQKDSLARQVQQRALEIADQVSTIYITDPTRQRELAYLIVVQARRECKVLSYNSETLKELLQVVIKDEKAFNLMNTDLGLNCPPNKFEGIINLAIRKYDAEENEIKETLPQKPAKKETLRQSHPIVNNSAQFRSTAPVEQYQSIEINPLKKQSSQPMINYNSGNSIYVDQPKKQEVFNSAVYQQSLDEKKRSHSMANYRSLSTSNLKSTQNDLKLQDTKNSINENTRYYTTRNPFENQRVEPKVERATVHATTGFESSRILSRITSSKDISRAAQGSLNQSQSVQNSSFFKQRSFSQKYPLTQRHLVQEQSQQSQNPNDYGTRQTHKTSILNEFMPKQPNTNVPPLKSSNSQINLSSRLIDSLQQPKYQEMKPSVNFNHVRSSTQEPLQMNKSMNPSLSSSPINEVQPIKSSVPFSSRVGYSSNNQNQSSVQFIQKQQPYLTSRNKNKQLGELSSTQSKPLQNLTNSNSNFNSTAPLNNQLYSSVNFKQSNQSQSQNQYGLRKSQSKNVLLQEKPQLDSQKDQNLSRREMQRSSSTNVFNKYSRSTNVSRNSSRVNTSQKQLPTMKEWSYPQITNPLKLTGTGSLSYLKPSKGNGSLSQMIRNKRTQPIVYQVNHHNTINERSLANQRQPQILANRSSQIKSSRVQPFVDSGNSQRNLSYREGGYLTGCHKEFSGVINNSSRILSQAIEQTTTSDAPRINDPRYQRPRNFFSGQQNQKYSQNPIISSTNKKHSRSISGQIPLGTAPIYSKYLNNDRAKKSQRLFSFNSNRVRNNSNQPMMKQTSPVQTQGQRQTNGGQVYHFENDFFNREKRINSQQQSNYPSKKNSYNGVEQAVRTQLKGAHITKPVVHTLRSDPFQRTKKRSLKLKHSLK